MKLYFLFSGMKMLPIRRYEERGFREGECTMQSQVEGENLRSVE